MVHNQPTPIRQTALPKALPEFPLLRTIKAPASKPGSDAPSLERLSGMSEAREWGRALAQDLQDYRSGYISSDDVDPGCVLYGPPGTGKTMFGAALAKTCNVNLVATSFGRWQSSDEGHLGDCQAAISDDFQRARDQSPCIFFIDELDSLPSRARKGRNADYWMAVVNHLLKELDSLKDMPGVVVVGACNHPDRLDPALVRAGRFDRMIEVTLPTVEELPDLIRYHLHYYELIGTDLSPVAVLCSGMSGADVQQLVREARRAARRQRQDLSIAHLHNILIAKTEQVDPTLRKRIACHEAGHAIAAVRLGVAENVTANMIDHGTSQGSVTMSFIDQSPTRAVIEQQITVLLAGRAAEELFLGEVSAGAGGGHTSDLARATSLALKTVTNWSLSKAGLTPWMDAEKQPDIKCYKPEIVAEVTEMLDAAYLRAWCLLKANREYHTAVTAALLDKHAIDHEAILALRPPSRNLFSGDRRDRRRANRNNDGK